MESIRNVLTNFSDHFAEVFVSFRTFFSPEQPLPTFDNLSAGVNNSFAEARSYLPEQFSNPFAGVRGYLPEQFNNPFAGARSYLPEQFNNPFAGVRSYLPEHFNNPLAGVRSYFPEQFNNALLAIKSYFSRQQQIPSSCNTNLVFIVTGLLNFLQVMSQGQESSLFQTHPKTINIAITSLLLYGLAYDADQRFSLTHPSSICVNIARRGMVVFGSLLLASLGSVFLPHKIQPLLYVFYVFVYADELQNWLQRRIFVEVRDTENGRLPV